MAASATSVGAGSNDGIKILLERNCGKKYQYTDEEIWTLVDQKIIPYRDAMDYLLNQYISGESLFCGILRTKENWYYALNASGREYYEADQMHELFKLKKETVHEWFALLSRCLPKKRGLVFYGPSNTGKSLLARALTSGINCGYIQRDGGTNVHWLENIYRKNCIIWEEPSVHMVNIEDVKLLLGGEPIVVNRKNKCIISKTNDPPVIITTNFHFWNYQPETLLNRISKYAFHRKIDSKGKYLGRRQITSYVLDVYDGRFD